MHDRIYVVHNTNLQTLKIMTKVTKIYWTIKTADKSWSGTDSEVQLEILRDSKRIILLDLEPGRTPRLDRSALATYYWEFKNPSGLGVSVSGTPVPYYESFPNGIEGHLRVKLIAKGDDAWEKAWIESNVYYGDLKGVPGTIDSVVWQEDWKTFLFNRDVVLSKDASEGYSSLTLLY
jgi:hypothetical protein